MNKGIVSKIIPFSSVDGPGNRMAIFLQGCNFNCLYCHNPETINPCNSCGECCEGCPSDSLSFKEGKVQWNEAICIGCDSCLNSCKRNSSPKVKIMTVEEVIEEIKKVIPFISGITVSGGECTLQEDFLVDLVREVKNMGLTGFIDTNGSLDLAEYKNLVDVIDSAMVDMKSYDPEEHKMLTGRNNNIVIKNIKYLGKLNKLYEVRTVVVPDVLDNKNNIDEISKLIASIDSYIRFKLIKYRPVGVRTDMINSHVPCDEIMENLMEIAIKNGCRNVIIV